MAKCLDMEVVRKNCVHVDVRLHVAATCGNRLSEGYLITIHP